MTEELFSKRLPITVKCSDREDRKVSINVTVENHTITTPVYRKELVVRLTDEADLFFLYTLRLAEEDFQSLKVQQGLLVDFTAFPQKFIDLLQLVLQEEHKETPKFVLDFQCSSGSLGTVTGTLNVIETNPFKYLTHLALKFLPGTDSDVKKYLADCLKALKDQNSTLLHKFEHTECDLSQQLRQAREALSARTLELDSLRNEWSARTSELTAKHAEELNMQKERALELQSNLQERLEHEKRELDQNHSKSTKQMEVRLYDLENTNKDLLDRKYKSESQIRELKGKLSGLEEEHHRVKQELHTMRKDNAGLDAGYHDQEKVIHQLRTRLAVLEQEVKTKEEVEKKSTDLLTSEQEQKRKVEEELERRQRQITKLEMSVKTLTEELVKGNEIIKKLQGEIRNYHTKLKLRSQVTTEQEKLLGEKGRDLEEMKKELENTKTTLRQKEDENQKLNESLDATMQKLEENRQLLKTNENVINWLNKQVTDSQLAQTRQLASGPFEMNSTTTTSSSHATYRPLQPQVPYGLRSAPSSSAGHTTPGSIAGAPTPSTVVAGAPPYQLRAAYSGVPQPQVHYQAGLVRKPGMPAPLAKSSPMNQPPIPEEQLGSTPHASPPVFSRTHPPAKPPAGDGVMDKYLQSSGEPPLRVGQPHATSPIPLHFSANTPPGGAAMSSRLSKDTLAPRPGQPVKSSQPPPLASAYFPGQTKVS